MPPPETKSAANSGTAAPRYCLGCGYALEGLAERRCPECGQAFEPDNPATFSPFPKDFSRPPQRAWKVFGVCLLLIVLMMVIVRHSPGLFGGEVLDWPIYALILIVLVLMLEAQSFSRKTARATAALEAMDWDTLVKVRREILRSWRPLALLIRTLLFRGALEAELATDFYHIGQTREALAMLDSVLARKRLRAMVRSAALDVRAKVYYSLGEYEKAAKDLAALEGELKKRVSAQAMLGLIELNQGRFAEAEARLRALVAQPSDQPDINFARINLATALYFLGRFDEALAALDHPFIDAFGHLDPNQARVLLRTQQGAGRLNWVRLRYARTMVPARLHAGVLIHLQRGEIDKAEQLVGEVDRVLTGGATHPWTLHAQHGFRAVVAAERGKVEAAKAELDAMWEISRRSPASSIVFTSPMFAGGVARRFGQFREAIEMYQQAVALATHPTNRHEATYWLAISARLAGDDSLAVDAFRRVIADGFDTWMSREARAALAGAASA